MEFTWNSTLIDAEQENSTSSAEEADMDSQSGLVFSTESIVIPVVIIGLLAFFMIGYCLYRLYEKCTADEDEEEEPSKPTKDVAVPIAEPEDFSVPVRPPPAKDDDTDADVEDVA